LLSLPGLMLLPLVAPWNAKDTPPSGGSPA
jgi:hypothetical protein